MNRLFWSIMTATLTVLVVAGVAQADSNAHLTYGDCDAVNQFESSVGPHVAAVWADDTTMFVGRTDGYVQAISRASGNLLWEYPSTFQPKESVRDVTGDGSKLYIAYSETENGGADPIVILDKADGGLIKRIKPWENLALPEDPFRLVVDGAFLYAGMNAGSIVKIDKNTGEIAKFTNGEPIIFRPQLHLGTDQPNGIYAMAIKGSTLFAARNFGINNETGEVPVALSHENNSILILTKGDLSPAPIPVGENEAPGEYRIRDDEGEVQDWGVFALQPDPADAELWIGGSDYRFWYRSSTPPNDNFFADRAIVGAATYVGGIVLDRAEVLANGNEGDGVPTYVATTGLQILADGQVAVSSTATLGGGDPGVLQLLRPTDLEAVRTGGANHGDILDLAMAPDGALIAGHQCVPMSSGPSVGLAIETGSIEDPAIKLLAPTGGDHIAGQTRITFDAAGAFPMQARLFVSEVGGECDDGQSCYRSLESMGVPEGRFQINSPFPQHSGMITIPVPEGFGHRLKIEVTDAFGRTATDFGEASFTVDRTPPEILRLAPAHEDIITTRSPTLEIAVRDELSELSTTGTRFLLNGRLVNAFEFDQNGIKVPLGEEGNARLKEGFNDLQAVISDTAGNVVATDAWTIIVDDSVGEPTITPVSSGWVRDPRPTLTAAFPEQVEIVQVIFNNTDVTEQVSVPPLGLGQGTKLHFQPDKDLSSRFEYTLSMTVRDQAGNVGGPGGAFSRTFKVDAAAPVISGQQPTPGLLLTNPRPTITFSPTDSGAGIDEETVAFFLDGQDLTSSLEKLPDRYRYAVPNPLSDGKHQVVVTVTDLAGNRATKTWDFTIDLTKPTISLSGILPGEQTAVKKGDEVVLQVRVADASGTRIPTIDARGLNGDLLPQETPLAVVGQPGLYELTLDVTRTTTQTVTLTATVEDAGGHISIAGWQVLLDNNPPVTSLEALPQFIGKSFQLKWNNDPDDRLVGGSGVAYYSLERKVGNQQWEEIRPRLETDRIDLESTQDPFTRLSFRVRAVDHAGNVQLAPSNVVETVTRGDPFKDVRYPAILPSGTDRIFSATPVDEVPLDESQVFVRMVDPEGNEYQQDLGRFGRLYTSTWNATGAPPGDYLLRYHFRDAEGFEMISQSYTIRIVDAEEAGLASTGDDKDTPMAPLLGLLAVGAAAMLRRKEVRP